METKYYILELIVRVFTGILFLFQGYDKLFAVKIKGVVEAFYFEAQKEHIPKTIVFLIAGFTSCVEFFGGFLLIVGAFKTVVLGLLGLDLVLVAIAFSLVETMWDMKHVFPRLLLVSILLALPPEWDYVSIDHFFNIKFF